MRDRLFNWSWDAICEHLGKKNTAIEGIVKDPFPLSQQSSELGRKQIYIP